MGTGPASNFSRFRCRSPQANRPRPAHRPGVVVGHCFGHYGERVTSRPSLLAASTIAPVELDLRRVFWVITGLWALALAVTSAIGLVGHIDGRTVAICSTGFALGFAALGWERWHFKDRAPEPSDG